MSLEPEQLEKQFFSDGYRLGLTATKNNLTEEKLNDAIREMHALVDQLTDSLVAFSKKQKQPVHCNKGCEWCCYQPIFALDYELNYLTRYLKTKVSIEKQQLIAERAENKRKRLEGLSGQQLLNSKYPCPLLESGACIAYEARPVACRIYLSTNVNSCLNFYNNPDDETKFPALLSFPMRLGRMMNEGFKSALKACGIHSEEFRIEEKILQ